jgi:hypothetical protein
VAAVEVMGAEVERLISAAAEFHIWVAATSAAAVAACISAQHLILAAHT